MTGAMQALRATHAMQNSPGGAAVPGTDTVAAIQGVCGLLWQWGNMQGAIYAHRAQAHCLPPATVIDIA